MSIVLPSLDSFTVILIGGTATLVNGGPEVDIRAEHAHDPLSAVTNAIAANSVQWWETATSLVRPMVAATNHLTQASIFGKRTVTTATPAGETKRTRLSSLLDGGVAAVKPETVAKPFADADWLLSDYQHHNIRQLNPGLRSQLFVSTDASVFTVLYERAPLFRQFESFVSDGSVLIVPHTRLAERFLNAYAEKQNLGREPDPTAFLRTSEDEADDLAKAHPPITADANFQVTGLFAANNWQNPRPLEAARQLKLSRYDMKAGLWDLVNDEALRETLLEEQPLAQATSHVIDLPAKYLHTARANLNQQSQHRLTAKERREAELGEVHKILRDSGWKAQAGAKDSYTYQILPTSDLRFDLFFNQRSAAAYLATSSEELLDEVIDACQRAKPTLRKLYADSEYSERAEGKAIWRAHGGENLTDLALRAADLRAYWESVFADLIGQAPSLFADQTGPSTKGTGKYSITLELDDAFPGLAKDLTRIAGIVSATIGEVQPILSGTYRVETRTTADMAVNSLQSARQTLIAHRAESRALRGRVEASTAPAELKKHAVQLIDRLDNHIDQLDSEMKRGAANVQNAFLSPPPPGAQQPHTTPPPPPSVAPPPPGAHSIELAELRNDLHRLVAATRSELDEIGTIRDTATSLRADSILEQSQRQMERDLRPRATKFEKRITRRSKRLGVAEQQAIRDETSLLLDEIDQVQRSLDKQRAIAALYPTKDKLIRLADQQDEAIQQVERQIIELGTITNRLQAKRAVRLLEAAKAHSRQRYLALDDLRKSVHPAMPSASSCINAVERLQSSELKSINHLSRQIRKASKLL